MGKMRPILFSTDMVRARLNNIKFVTRRKVKKLNEKCRYGNVGDILWVKETFAEQGADIVYAADVQDEDWALFRWKPSIFMKKEYARIFLRITNIRIERVNEITRAEAIKEGVENITGFLKIESYRNYLDSESFPGSLRGFSCPIRSFESLWKSINGENSWDENPYVWVISFEQIEKP